MQNHTQDPVLARPTGTKGDFKQEKAPQDREMRVEGREQGIRRRLYENQTKGWGERKA